MQVLPIILYFSAFISVLYYLGVMQWLIAKIAWLMQISLHTSATESMVAAGRNFEAKRLEKIAVFFNVYKVVSDKQNLS